MESRRLADLVREALRLEGAARAAFLDEACGADAELRARVERLVDEQDSATRVGEPEEAPAVAAAAAPAAPSDVKRIGPYSILGVLGEGGMGMVYLAEQDNPKRTIALKVIRPGLLTPELLRRFEHESQVLGLLQHPGIAQIYAAGTADGTPYFAMEHVKGVPLNEHVAARRPDVRARLALAIRICEAVHHAHQKGVVHRDLKPANILVDADGRPKILDFGIARVTDRDLATATMQTDTGQLVGTVPYMSPEQIAGDIAGLDTRSDVYTLGVILYELLADRLPHRVHKTSLAEAARLITETDPPPLGALDKRFRGDLQTIAGKALEKDKERRYESAAELAADLKRYLADEPISARPPTTGYQLAKFAKRNKGLVAGLLLALVTLVAGVVATTVYAFRAEERRVEAEQARRKAEREEAKAQDARRKAEDEETKAQEARRTAEKEAAIAQATRDFLINMLKSIDPEVALGREITVRELIDGAAATASFPDQPLVEAEVRNTLAQAYRGLGKLDAAVAQVEQAVAAARREWGGRDVNTAAALRNLAIFRREQARYAEAEKLVREALAILTGLVGREHAETAVCLGELASVLQETGRMDEAEELFQESIRVGTATLGARDPFVVQAMHNYGTLLTNRGRFQESEKWLREVLAIRLDGRGKDHPLTSATMNALGNSLARQGRRAEAVALLRRSLAIRERVYGRGHAKTMIVLQNIANALVQEKRFADAEPLIREVVATCTKRLGDTHPQTISALNTLAYLLEDTNRVAEAETVYRTLVAARRRTSGADSPDTWPPMNNLAMLLQKQGKAEEADALFREVLALCDRNLPAGHFLTAIFRNNHGDCLTDLRRYAEAEQALLATLPALETVFKTRDHPRVKKARARLVKLYEAWGKPDEAVKYR